MKQIIKNLIKISTFSMIFILSFFIINTFASSGITQEINTNPNNNANYKKITIKPISHVAVAITTNIGLGLNNKSKLDQSSINPTILSINDFYKNPDKVKEKLIKTHMIFLKEYYTILKMDFNKILKKSNNREKTLNNIIKQLSIRLKKANQNLQILQKQREILLNEYNKITNQINNLKKELEIDFNNFNTTKVFNHVDNYYSLKQKEIIIKTNIVFINNFIRKYVILNKYNSELLHTINLNRDIIIKDSYLVIPKSGTKLLKDFELLYNEDEFKLKIKNN